MKKFTDAYIKFKNIITFINKHPLGKQKKILSYIRFLNWQIAQSIIPKLVMKNWVNNIQIMVKKGMTGITGSIYVGLHEFEEMCFILHYLNKNDTFIDIGANVGCYTLLAASKNSSVIAFEPDFDSLSTLNLNVKVNNFDNVTIYSSAVGEKQQNINFTKGLDTVNHVVKPNEINSKIVKMINIDSVPIENNNIVMKIDVEGYEENVLKGSKDYLKDKVEVVIVETNNSNISYGSSNDQIFDYLKDFGFKAYTYNPFSRDLVSISSDHIGNTIFIKNYEETTSRLENADFINVMSVHI